MSGAAIRIHYYEGNNLRFLKGILLEENEDFVKIELEKKISPRFWRRK